jgi:hypothetical protein
VERRGPWATTTPTSAEPRRTSTDAARDLRTGGHNATYAAASAMVHGFALEPDVAYRCWPIASTRAAFRRGPSASSGTRSTTRRPSRTPDLAAGCATRRDDDADVDLSSFDAAARPMRLAD